MPPILLVAIGGAVGSAARFAIASALNPAPTEASGSAWSGFPTGTFAINLIGCALIGLIAGWLGIGPDAPGSPGAAWRPLLIAGVLGGFTTFSAFGIETVSLLRSGAAFPAAVYVVASTTLGITLAWLGFLVASKV